MKELLKILILEDDTDDAEEIMRRLLLNEKFNCEFRLAIDKDAYLLALDEFYPSMILSDYSLPQFNSKEAFIIARQRFPGIPFIMVTGTISEEFEVDMIKMGVDDYILKDRMTRLPAAIITSVQRSKSEKEKQEAEQKIIQSETNLRAIFENTSEGFLLLDKDAVIMAFNKKAARYIYIYKETEFEIGHSIYDFIEESRKGFFLEIIEKVKNGESVQYDRSYEVRKGKHAWIDFSVTPVIETGQVKGICITGRDITEKKLMEQEIMDRKILEQKKIARAILRAQEKERNYLGQELHDNVNQILAATKMLLSMVKYDPENSSELIISCQKNIEDAIKENRKMAQGLVVPDFETIPLRDQLSHLTDNMLKKSGIQVIMDTTLLQEEWLEDEQKLVIYRIAQEQCTNIGKHAEAGLVYILLTTTDGLFKMIIFDNGNGARTGIKTDGIGLRNIRARLSIFNGTANINTTPGKDFTLEIIIPIVK